MRQSGGYRYGLTGLELVGEKGQVSRASHLNTSRAGPSASTKAARRLDEYWSPGLTLAVLITPAMEVSEPQESSTKVSVSEEPRGRAPGAASPRPELRAEENSKAEEEVDSGKEDWPAGVRHVSASEDRDEEDPFKIFNTSGGAINQSVCARRCLTGFTEPLRGCYSHGHDTSLLVVAIDPAKIASTSQAHVAEDTSFVLATAAAIPESASIFVPFDVLICK